MTNWRDDFADQNLRMAQKMLEQQGEVNAARAEVAALRQQLDEARAKIDKARDLVGDLVRADNNSLGHGANGRITGADTLPLQQLLGMCLTLRYGFEGTEDETRDRLRRALADRDILWQARAAAEADRDRLLVVYRAAEAWREYAGSDQSAEEAALIAAVDSYRSAAPAEPATVWTPAKNGCANDGSFCLCECHDPEES